MAAPETTKFQVNFKSPDGTLINLYASSKEELEALLTAAQDFSALITSVSQSFGSVGNAQAVSTGGLRVVSGQAPQVASSAPQAVNVCRHGNMNFQQGVSAKGPWKGWMCASPKGTP